MVIVLLATASASIATPHERAGAAVGTRAGGTATPLFDGFTVAKGTSLVGAVFPALTGGTAGAQPEPTGRLALLAVDTDGRTALTRYAAQATRAGFRDLTSAEPACRLLAPGDLHCGATFLDGGREVDLYVRVCRSCATPVSAATLRLVVLATGGATPSTSPDATPRRPQSPTLRLSASERTRAAKMPRAGAELFPMPDQFDFDPIAVVAGSKPLGRVWFGDVCERDFVAVVELTGNADEVFRRYVAATLPNGGTERRARSTGSTSLRCPTATGRRP